MDIDKLTDKIFFNPQLLTRTELYKLLMQLYKETYDDGYSDGMRQYDYYNY